MNNANWVDYLLCIGLIIVLTIAYFGLRKFISWALNNDNKWYREHGCLGMSKDELENRKKWAHLELTNGYLLLVGVLIFLLVMAIIK